MSLNKCITQLLDEDKLTFQQARRARELYVGMRTHYEAAMGRPAAEALASEHTVAALERDAIEGKRRALLQVTAQKRMIVDMQAYDRGSGKHPGAAALALFDHDGRAPYANVDAQRKAILGRAHALMTDILFKHGRSAYGVEIHDKAGLDDLVRAAFGEKTENRSAAELADAWGQAAEMLRLRFNAAGGAIDRMEGWGLPQSHDSDAIRAAGWETWRDAILSRLDASKMIDQYTGRPFTGAGLDAALHDVFDTIRSDGLNKLVPGRQGRGSLATSRAESRFLRFKSADDWMAYADEYGSRDAFDTMMGHISGMSRDIAHMEVLGPNPAATVRWLQDGITKQAAIGDDTGGGKRAAAVYSAFRVGQMYDATSGALSSPVHPKAAYWLGSTRSLLTAAKLGAAQLSAITDVSFQAVTRKFNGLPVAGALTGYFKLLNPAARADRRTAVRLGLIAEEASRMSAAQNRYLGEAVTSEVARRLAEGVLRASGLSAWTQVGRWAFGMEMLGHLADHVADHGTVAHEALPTAFRGMLERYGFGPSDWAKLRQTPLYEQGGASFLRPQDVADTNLGDRLLRMVHTETAYAVPEATVRARSMMSFGRPGSIAGEISRNVGLFKSFGVSLLLTHGLRAMQQQPYNRAMYTAGLALTSTLLGAMVLQLKALVSKGEDFRPMTGLDGRQAAEFWGAAMLQGGGFGIFGDFLGQATSERASGSGTFTDAFAGPVVGSVTDLAALTGGNIAKAIDGKNVNLGRDAVKTLRSYTPGSTLWYTRLAMDRLLWDQLQMQIDPRYPDAFRRMHQRASETNQDYWWSPGETAPSRAPQMASGGAQ